jgi:FAD synthetase
MKKVLAFGTFDKIHKGHIYYLKQAKKHGHLTVVIARDLTVRTVKGKFPENNEQKRLSLVKKLNIADNLILGNFNEKYTVLDYVKPDIVALGYDQKAFTDNLREELEKRRLYNTKILRMKELKD